MPTTPHDAADLPQAALPNAPLPWTPACEQAEDDEAETARELVETMRGISETVARDEGHAFRSVHAKSHALLHGRLHVPQLPPELAQGVFATPGEHAAILRLSSSPGDLLEDGVSTPRGLALKILDVAGERLEPADGAATQDFLMINGPVFTAPTAKKFLQSLKLLAATTDKAPGAKKLLSAALRGLESLVEKAGGESPTLKALGGHPATHPLGEIYYTQVPLRYGPFMAKLSLAPVSPELLALHDAPVDLGAGPNALRDAVVAHFAEFGGTWELRVQLCVDLAQMPIEDASVRWPEDLSPFLPVARLVVPAQDAWNTAGTPGAEDRLAFSPWRGIEAHRPLGSIMRVRRQAYAMAAAFRRTQNGVPQDEPASP
ncbi:catalase family protein [Pseudorhodoferax sp. Leaf274]|uniref:catalase family protein n=1 Tax=Pseudorhodoferax sp. Leaf274 TaxID=1736318 RepID=UPI00070323AF|nr:catalase family protein [Pseudorhodoferax sp. Leaf274]KQP37411.1 catalase [Pseudorhodoferax sp. Leaf274]